MIPPPHFTPRDKQKVPQQLITPKLGLPAVCPKLQLFRREQTSPRLVSQKEIQPQEAQPQPYSAGHTCSLCPESFQKDAEMQWSGLGSRSGAVAVWSQHDHSQDTSHGRMWAEGAEFVHSWSPFLLLTQILLYSAFEAESDHTVLGRGILLGCQGLASVVQQEGLDGSGCW